MIEYTYDEKKLFLGGFVSIGAILNKCSNVSITDIFIRIITRVKNRGISSIDPLLDNAREIATLPEEYKNISIEMALNSRCTSDYDDNPKNFHWGMFDHQKKLSSEQISRILENVSIPRFTNQVLDIRAGKRYLTFISTPTDSNLRNEWVMVESGMQQQALCLICSALGVGLVFKSLGENGVFISDSEHANIKIKLDPMKPSYGGSFWSDSLPKEKKPWVKGNLPDPVRNGKKSIIQSFGNLKVKNKNGMQATDEDMAQLLWAARGRTPHYYKSRPWGMTIPTNQGRQNISGVYLLWGTKIFKYVNWEKNRPTHSILKFAEVKKTLLAELKSKGFLFNRTIILAINEISGNAFWEVGYQLFNLFLQAHSLDIQYSVRLLDEGQKIFFKECGIDSAVATFLI